MRPEDHASLAIAICWIDPRLMQSSRACHNGYGPHLYFRGKPPTRGTPDRGTPDRGFIGLNANPKLGNYQPASTARSTLPVKFGSLISTTGVRRYS